MPHLRVSVTFHSVPHAAPPPALVQVEHWPNAIEYSVLTIELFGIHD
jgi:hypothetical protein